LIIIILVNLVLFNIFLFIFNYILQLLIQSLLFPKIGKILNMKKLPEYNDDNCEEKDIITSPIDWDLKNSKILTIF
jgi:hypothetical protein